MKTKPKLVVGGWTSAWGSCAGPCAGKKGALASSNGFSTFQSHVNACVTRQFQVRRLGRGGSEADEAKPLAHVVVIQGCPRQGEVYHVRSPDRAVLMMHAMPAKQHEAERHWGARVMMPMQVLRKALAAKELKEASAESLALLQQLLVLDSRMLWFP